MLVTHACTVSTRHWYGTRIRTAILLAILRLKPQSGSFLTMRTTTTFQLLMKFRHFTEINGGVESNEHEPQLAR